MGKSQYGSFEPALGRAFSPDLELTAEIVAAYISNNPVPASELPDLIAMVAGSIKRLAARNAGSGSGVPSEFRILAPPRFEWREEELVGPTKLRPKSEETFHVCLERT